MNQQEEQQEKPQRKQKKPQSEAQLARNRKGGQTTARRKKAKGGRNSQKAQRERMGEEEYLASRRRTAPMGGKAKTGIPQGWTRAKVNADRERAAEECILPTELPKELTEATGLKVNPLMELEKLGLQEVISTKDRIDIWKTLATYTHQKQATKVESKAEVLTHEAVVGNLLETAKTLEYSDDEELYIAQDLTDAESVRDRVKRKTR